MHYRSLYFIYYVYNIHSIQLNTTRRKGRPLSYNFKRLFYNFRRLSNFRRFSIILKKSLKYIFALLNMTNKFCNFYIGIIIRSLQPSMRTHISLSLSLQFLRISNLASNPNLSLFRFCRSLHLGQFCLKCNQF